MNTENKTSAELRRELDATNAEAEATSAKISELMATADKERAHVQRPETAPFGRPPSPGLKAKRASWCGIGAEPIFGSLWLTASLMRQ
jgi:hypothetical protein